MNERRKDPASLGAAEAFWRSYGLPRRGEFGGRCSNVLCSTTGANWCNRSSGLYYCGECARRINDSCLKLGERNKMCELHIATPTDLIFSPAAR